MAVTIKIHGMDALAGQFEALKRMGTGPEIQQALNEAAEMLRDEVHSRAPIAPRTIASKGKTIAPGGLKRSVKAAPGRKKKTFLQSFVFSLSGLAPHAHLVEYGTKAHTITGKVLRFFTGGRVASFSERVGIFARQAVDKFGFARGKVPHPGAKANPFFGGSVKAKRSAIKRHLEASIKAAYESLGRETAAGLGYKVD